MCTCYRSQFSFQPPLKRQGPITILSRLCWFSGSNPCSRCLLSTHLLWQPSDKQLVLKEVSHNQIFPAETLLSLSIKWNPGYWVGPWDPSIEVGYGPVLRPSLAWATLILPGHLYPQKTPSWEPSRCLCHLSCSLCQLGTSRQQHQESKHTRPKIVTACRLDWALRTFLLANCCAFWRSGRLRNLHRTNESNLCQLVIYSNHLRFAYVKKYTHKNTFPASDHCSPFSHTTSLMHPYPLNLHGTLQKNGIN